MPRGPVAGTDSHTFAVAVPTGTTHVKVKVTLSHPSLAVVGINGTNYTVTVRDAAGQLLGITESLTEGAGTASAFIDLRSFHNSSVAYGAFTFEVSGKYAASDPDPLDSDSLLGRVVALRVAQLIAGRCPVLATPIRRRPRPPPRPAPLHAVESIAMRGCKRAVSGSAVG